MPAGAPTPSATPTDEPLTLEETKLAIKVDTDDDDTFIRGAIGTAREMCEEDLGIALLPQAFERVLDRFPECEREISLPRPPLTAVETVRYFDSNGNGYIFDPGNYIVDADSYPGRIVLKLGAWWPSQVQLRAASAVRIRFSCGYRSADAIPHRLKQGMLLIVGALYRHREAVVETTRTSAISALMLDSQQTAVDRLWKRYKPH